MPTLRTSRRSAPSQGAASSTFLNAGNAIMSATVTNSPSVPSRMRSDLPRRCDTVRMIPHREDRKAPPASISKRRPSGARSSCRRGRKMLPMTISQAFSSCSHPQTRASPTIMPGRNFADSRIRQFVTANFAMGAALRPAPHTVRNRPEREAPERESFRQRAETSLPHATSHLRFAGNPRLTKT